MAENGTISAMYKSTRPSLGDWSRSEYLYIQLHSELLFAVAYLPAAPCPCIDDASQYIGYCQYFATPHATTDDPLEEAGSGVVKGIKTFIDKRDELSGWIMWALRATKMKAIVNSDDPEISNVKVSPAMLQGYRQIREQMGVDTYVDNPKFCPALWSFLQGAARNQFPQFSGDPTQAEPTQDVDTNADMDMDITSITGSVPANDLADTSDHDSTDENKIPDAEDDVNPGTTRLGPDDFAREIGTVRCTRYMPSNGQRCRRRAATENEDRRSWLCHNHDPVEKKKKKILADRLARNKAAKAAKGSRPAKPKQQKKQKTVEK
jgi:hypothetical protein